MSKAFGFRLFVGIPTSLAMQSLFRRHMNLHDDISSVAAFVGAIGTLYSVLAGFTVITVWQQFIDIDRAVKREARGLRELWRYVGYVDDAEGVTHARASIEKYRDPCRLGRVARDGGT